MFNFVFDRSVHGRPYPNLAPEFDVRTGYAGIGDTYPWIVPVRLWYYAQDHGYPINVSYLSETIPDQAWYPVGLGFFDFSIDYFAMMSDRVRELLKKQQLRVLFYYHEGDDPVQEKVRLDQLVNEHGLPKDCYVFVSGNSRADDLANFVYFADHELFYWRNSVVWNDKIQPGCEYHTRERTRQFTLLSRVHKWWRATIVCYLKNREMLDNSYWSYNTVVMDDDQAHNPIEIDLVPGMPNLRKLTEEFLAGAPYRCDSFDATQQNSHWMFVPEHFANSYCNIVLETLFDAEGTQGTFLTEKSFKPLRHAQPLVMFGTVNSIKTLKDLGYQTFDSHIDHSYDAITHNTKRFLAGVREIQRLKTQNLHDLYVNCRSDILHNQDLFLSSKYSRLNTLNDKLLHKLSTS